MTYPGGKNGSGVYQRIINLMPPHATYIEAFLGSGAILRMKKPALCSIGIDIDGGVFERWRGNELAGLSLIQADAIAWLERRFPHESDPGGPTLIYCDPPYMIHTRRQHRLIYRYELSDDDHRELLRILLRLPCMVMISGYWSELYSTALSRWRAVRYTARTRGGSLAEEWIWMNFPAPLELHDYRYLGQNFRERERIGRKRKRWLTRLRGMPELERFAILSALEELRCECTHSINAAPGEAGHPGEHVIFDDAERAYSLSPLPGAIARSGAVVHNMEK